MTGHTELLDAPQTLPAVRPAPQLPVEHAIEGNLPPLVRTVVSSHAIIWTVILTFGPLGLPLIWLSPKYRLWSKLLTTFITLGVTIVLPIALTIYCTQYLIHPVLNAMENANASGGAL